MLAHGPTAAAKPADSLERALLATAGALAAALVVCCGLVLAVRRMGGGFEPLDGRGVLAVAALGGLLVVACDAAAKGVGLAQPWRHVARLGYLCALGAVAVPFRAASGLDMALFVAGAGLAGTVVAGPFIRGTPRGWLAASRGRRPAMLRSLRPPMTPPTLAVTRQSRAVFARSSDNRRTLTRFTHTGTTFHDRFRQRSAGIFSGLP